MTAEIEEARNQCRTCHRNAPSQAKLPPTAPKLPTTPFQMIYADYFQLIAKHYLIIGDRLSGWTEVVKADPGTSSSGSKGLCEALRRIFLSFGVPEEISSDGGPEFVSAEAEDFYQRWGVSHRLSSAYFPQSNGRAEVAVKLTKRLLEDNVGVDGTLNTDKVVRALLQQRNTPDKDCQLSPAQVIFGRSLRDAMPQLDKSIPIFESDRLHNQWHEAWSAKEEAIRSRLVRSCEDLEDGSKELPPLREGDSVVIQNQDKSSGRPNKWDRQGKVVASKDNDQYLVKVDGSGRLTLRNRRFLRKFQLRTDTIPQPVPSLMPSHQNPADSLTHPPNSHDAKLDKKLSSAPDAMPTRTGSIVPGGMPSVVPSTVVGPATGAVPSVGPAYATPTSAPSVTPSVMPSVVPSPAVGVVPSIGPIVAPGQAPYTPMPSIGNGESTESTSVRRLSPRQHVQRSVYDAATGTYVAPASR